MFDRRSVTARPRRALLRLATACGLIVAAPAGADTLAEALAQAYRSNPTLLSVRAQLRATDEAVPQALSGWRPTVQVTGAGGKALGRTGSVSEQNLTPWSAQLDITQPLYRGGRTVASTEAADAAVRAGRQQLRAQERNVLLAAVTAYIDVLRDAARLQLTRNNEVVLQRQLDATVDRFTVGEVTRTDVAQAEARLSRSNSDRAAAEGDLAASRATYERVVGMAPGSLEPAPPLPALPANLQEAVAVGVAENPDVRAASEAEQAALHQIEVARGSLLPTLNLVGRSQRSDEQTLEDTRTRSDALLAQVVVPLYQAGTVYSQVREARQVQSQRLVEIETARRQAVENVTQAWERLQATRSAIRSLTDTVRAAEIALDGVRQEAAVGSRTTLDVLDAEQELLDARVRLVIADRDEYVAGFSLLAAIGRLSARQLNLPVEYYDPEAHYREVRDQWFGTTPGGLYFDLN